MKTTPIYYTNEIHYYFYLGFFSGKDPLIFWQKFPSNFLFMLTSNKFSFSLFFLIFLLFSLIKKPKVNKNYKIQSQQIHFMYFFPFGRQKNAVMGYGSHHRVSTCEVHSLNIGMWNLQITTHVESRGEEKNEHASFPTVVQFKM